MGRRSQPRLDTGAILKVRVLLAAVCYPAVMGLLPRRAGLFFFPETFTLTPLTYTLSLPYHDVMPTMIKELTCLRCGIPWLPRKAGKPKACPNCKSRKWDEVKA